jgi:hypothetical protein
MSEKDERIRKCLYKAFLGQVDVRNLQDEDGSETGDGQASETTGGHLSSGTSIWLDWAGSSSWAGRCGGETSSVSTSDGRDSCWGSSRSCGWWWVVESDCWSSINGGGDERHLWDSQGGADCGGRA